MHRGIDVSHHQPPEAVDYEKIAETHDWVYVRAAYGDRKDEHFGAHVQKASAAGLMVGGYLFVRQRTPAVNQLDVFRRQLAEYGLEEACLPPCLDVEYNKYDGPLDRGVMRPIVHALYAELMQRYGQLTVYTTQKDWRILGDPPWLQDAGVHLWVAHWGVKEPATPMGLSWTFWQYEVGRIEGFAADIDKNVSKTIPILKGAKTDPLDTSPDSPSALGVERLEKELKALTERQGRLEQDFDRLRRELAQTLQQGAERLGNGR